MTTDSAKATPTTVEPPPTTEAAVDVVSRLVSLAVGTNGVTYQDGEPPSGPSSFTVLPDGSIVIADTMAVALGTPRLVVVDPSGKVTHVDLLPAEVAAVADIVADGNTLAILDIDIARLSYRVVRLTSDGEVISIATVPEGYHFEDGLSGLLADHDGVLLEFAGGETYARIDEDGEVTGQALPTFDGEEISITGGDGRATQITVGQSSWTVERNTDLGGVFLVGVSSLEIVVSVDEVDTSGEAWVVTHRILRFTRSGVLVSETVVNPASQHVEIMRPFELGADGVLLFLSAGPAEVRIIPETDEAFAALTVRP